jgi:hypothetical protein
MTHWMLQNVYNEKRAYTVHETYLIMKKCTSDPTPDGLRKSLKEIFYTKQDEMGSLITEFYKNEQLSNFSSHLIN